LRRNESDRAAGALDMRITAPSLLVVIYQPKSRFDLSTKSSLQRAHALTNSMKQNLLHCRHGTVNNV
jgi:hypothetical protein